MAVGDEIDEGFGLLDRPKLVAAVRNSAASWGPRRKGKVHSIGPLLTLNNFCGSWAALLEFFLK